MSLSPTDPYAAYGPRKYESAESIVDRILVDLGRESERQNKLDQYLLWIWAAQEDMGAPIAYTTKYVEEHPTDCVLCKPCDMIALNRMLVLTNSCCGSSDGDWRGLWPYACGTVPIYTTIDRAQPQWYRNWWAGNGNAVYNNVYQVEDHPTHWITSDNMNGCMVGIEYKAWFFGPDGYPVVDNTYYNAILAYVYMKLIQQARGSGRKTYTPTDWDMARRDYKVAKQQAKHNNFFEEITPDGVYQLGAILNDARALGGPYSRQQKSAQFLNDMYARRFANYQGNYAGY